MGLKVFDYIDDVTSLLEASRKSLEESAKNIEIYLNDILCKNSDSCLNINSRVKSSMSLKEKILRNNYYSKYNTPEELMDNLSDLIGVRIECRFIQDEYEIYKILKKHFNTRDKNGLYYNPINENVRLSLGGKQPQRQKNGFEIYRIDGLYKVNGKTVNFELQIKSLVNVFWSEIEHKVIYKNYNYMLADSFFKEMMTSIKRNLAMIDNQLLIIYEQLNKMNSINPAVRKDQVESLLSKIIYDIFSTRVKNSLGFNVDFRISCDIIMEYIFGSNNVENLEEYNNILLKTLNRFNDISKNEIEFDEIITFERDICFEDKFSQIVGQTILDSINEDFQWNLFFKIVFEIEPGNNAEDFENFIDFLKNRFCKNESFLELHSKYSEEEWRYIVDIFLEDIAICFKEINSIEFLHSSNLKKINRIIEDTVSASCIENTLNLQCNKDIDELRTSFREKILMN